MSQKQCSTCKITKSITSFSKHLKRGTQGRCKTCVKLLYQQTKGDLIAVDDLPNEKWKPIKNFEQLYAVSNMGRVKRTSYGKGVRRKSLMTGYLNSTGYYRVSLTKKNKQVKAFIHRLVAEAFLVSDNNRTIVNHIDCNRTNNKLSNLEFVSFQENSEHAQKLNRYKNNLSIAKVREIKKLLAENTSQTKIVEKLGVSKYQVSKIHTGKTFSYIE